MNPFELQGELARQWLALAGGLASMVFTAFTPRLDGRAGHEQHLAAPQRSGSHATNASIAAPPFCPSLLVFNPMLAFAPWIVFLGPRHRSVEGADADQVSTNYRSAGGHAVATIIGPGRIETRKDPRP